MSRSSFAGRVIVCALTVGIATPGFGQDKPSLSLTQYIQKMKWDHGKTPLIAIDSDDEWPNDGAPDDLADAYERKVVKVGGLNVICLTWAIDLDEQRLPNAYQSLTDDEKLTFLLANISKGQLAKLTGEGLCADDLEGEPRAALLSMLPQPFTYVEGIASGSGFRGSSDPVTVPPEQMHLVRLQLAKGIDIGFDATRSVGGGQGYSNLSSLSFRQGPVVRLMGGLYMGRQSELKGQVVESYERKSALSWKDPRLEKMIELKTGTIAAIVDQVSKATGIELYADRRISGLTLNTFGGQATAADLIRGIALGIGGAVRQVRPAYVITSGLEGTGSRETRLLANRQIGQIAIREQLKGWTVTVMRENLLDTLSFSKNDSMGASLIPQDAFYKGGNWDANWAPLSDLPPSLRTAINQYGAGRRPDKNTIGPVPGLQDRVRITSSLGYRFVLPDGRPLDAHRYDPNMLGVAGITNVTSTGGQQVTYPLDPATFAKGLSVAIRSDDSDTVATTCAKLKSIGINTLWLESQNPAAIQAAIATGLTTDLMIRPWNVLKGERCSDPDRTVTGQTGAQLEEIPGAKYDSRQRMLTNYRDTFSPADPNLPAHWNRLARLTSAKGLHGVVIENADPEGYEDSKSFRPSMGVTIVNGVRQDPGIQDLAPPLFSFGYSTDLRLKFLRENQIDPIDLPNQTWGRFSPPQPFFDSIMRPQRFSAYPKIHFPRTVAGGGDFQQEIAPWMDLRHDALQPRVTELCDLLANAAPLYVQTGPFGSHAATWSVMLYGAKGPERQIFVFSMNPPSCEDAQGNISAIQPYWAPNTESCFDLRDVDPSRFSAYLNYLFKPAK